MKPFTSVSALIAFGLACVLPLSACLAPGDLTVVAGVADYRDSGDFVRVSSRAYDSELGSDTRIDVWVSKGAAGAYARIAPESKGSGATLPYGTVIVREVYDKKTAELLKLTLMVKGPEGVVPDLADWWYAVTDPAGVPLLDAEGNPRQGDLKECRGCHEERPKDDFLFGVPGDVRARGMELGPIGS